MRNNQQYGSLSCHTQSWHRTGKGQCHSRVFYGLGKVWQVSKDSERRVCSCGHPARRRKLTLCGRSHFRAGVWRDICAGGEVHQLLKLKFMTPVSLLHFLFLIGIIWICCMRKKSIQNWKSSLSIASSWTTNTITSFEITMRPWNINICKGCG